MVDREILATRLSRLRTALKHLHRIREKPLAEYLGSEVDRALSEHYLRIALEGMLDIGNHILASTGGKKPLHLRDIPITLGSEGILSEELARKLARATGLRNRLVHGYADIDHALLYHVLRSDLGDLEAFAVAVGKYCDQAAE